VRALKRLGPLSTTEPIREIDEALEALLASLSDDDWRLPAVKDWRVRDVAAHLLDTNLRRLSLDRDHHQPDGAPPPEDPENFQSWVEFLNRLNADWTRAAERLSPAVILQLLRITNTDVTSYFEGLDPEAPASFGVQWARPSESKVWLDVAREYTEKWHHQQQIRDAVGAPLLDAPHLLLPLIETLLRAVPLAYDSVDAHAEAGASVLMRASDLDAGVWLLRKDDQWNLYEANDDTTADATIGMTSDAMWRFLMKQMPRDVARASAETSGTPELITPFFEAVAVMA
jgi:uncharacterized protein (TIGR03083 family)